MFEEMRLAAILAKTAVNDPTALPARDALLMATRQGAEALFLGEMTGSIEAGKRADVIVVVANPLHNMPQFARDTNAVYSQIVYTGHAADVRHVWCNGRLLMQDRALLTIDENAILEQAQQLAHQIDSFLTKREESVLSKLVAIGGLERSESFEVQVKVALPDAVLLERLLLHDDVQIMRTRHYHQYDTYFLFDDPAQGRVRYREDDLLDEEGEVRSVRTRLTLTMPTKQREFDSTVLLSHSRFIADAPRPLRFYREYFKPQSERELEKERRRWHIHYQGVQFYINLDKVIRPSLEGLFLEIKSRTWSAQDAENKAQRILVMLQILGVSAEAIVNEAYIEMRDGS
jgi:5-methylthioadenosine/S-adenosylhomocysteine deaminase